jgi:ABC-type Fe3+-hydroxamate transport system substrate-binding protein
MLRDILGRPLTIDLPPRRVVSLVPSITETLFELGAGTTVVGITDFCIFPPGLALPRVGGTKNPNVDLIRELGPDLVYMNLEENVRRHADAIEAFAPLFVTEPKSVDDVTGLIQQLGIIHARTERAASFIATLRDTLDTTPRRPFTFACPIWKEPWMWCGGDTYVSHLVEAAGGTNVLANQLRYPQLPLAEVLALKPEIVFLPDEPYPFADADATALHGPRVIGPFPGHLFTWHGTRTIHGLRFLQDVLEE